MRSYFQPEGDPDSPAVQAANRMAARIPGQAFRDCMSGYGHGHVRLCLRVPSIALFFVARLAPMPPSCHVCDVFQDSPGNVSGDGQGRGLVSGAAFQQPRLPLTPFSRPAIESESGSQAVPIYSSLLSAVMLSSRVHCKLSLLAEVFKQSFWMKGFGAATPKRTVVWSNSTGVRFFCTSRKARSFGQRGPALADVYYDRAGKKRYKGNRLLKGSQPGAQPTLSLMAYIVL